MRQHPEARSQKSEVRSRHVRLLIDLTSDLRPLTSSRLRRGFTLTELLIVILIIGIMTGLALSAMSGATELACEQRTRSIIAKLDQLIMERYEGFRTRAVPVNTTTRQANLANPRQAA